MEGSLNRWPRARSDPVGLVNEVAVASRFEQLQRQLTRLAEVLRQRQSVLDEDRAADNP